MQRCARCILPETYPGIVFDKAGVCNYCNAYEKRAPRPHEELIRLVESSPSEDREYDCIVGVSGGRDSSYALYYLTEVCKLRVLAYTADHGFVHETAKANVRGMAEALGVELVVEQHDHLRKCIRHNVSAWLRNPSPAMIPMICCGCRLGMFGGLLKCAQRRNIPLVVLGIGGPVETYIFKSAFFTTNPIGRIAKAARSETLASSAGLLYEVLRNPRYFLHPVTVKTYLEESFHFFYVLGLPKALTSPDYEVGRRLLYPDQRVLYLYRYIAWDEQVMRSALRDEVGWAPATDRASPWHFDCSVSLLKDYLYHEMVGFTEVDDKLSNMVREGMITREEALRRLETQGAVPWELVEGLCEEIGVNAADVRAAVTQKAEER